MKKSTMAALAALVMVFIYIFTAGNKLNVYEKEVFYETPEEAISNFIGFVNVQEKVKDKNGSYYNEAPKEFLESISKRYRLYSRNGKYSRHINESFPSFKQCTIKEIKEDENKNNIISNYNESFREIKGYKRPEEIRVFRIDAEDYFYNSINREDVNKDGTVKADFDNEMYKDQDNKYITSYLVVIDEGEGYVVDYYNMYY